MKLVVVEDGSDLAAELWGSAYPAASSILAYPEGRAALAAARHLDRLGKREHQEAATAFEELFGEMVGIGVDEELAARAGEHAENLGLRGYDAVHLATALELGDEEVVLVSWDRDLARAGGWPPCCLRGNSDARGALGSGARNSVGIGERRRPSTRSTRRLLLAAAAEESGVALVHYHRDYERIAAASELRQEWLATDGALA